MPNILKNKVIYILLIICFFASAKASAQSDDYFKNKFLRFENFIYNDSIKSFNIHTQDWEFSAPIIELNSEQKLVFSFDELDSDVKQYEYTLVHCDYKWEKSPLEPNEYFESFTNDRITSYEYSRNTIQRYVHYSASFPNDNLKPTKSGNYLLIVYAQDNPEQIIISWRILITEQKVDIVSKVKQATNIDDRSTRHEIDFSIISNNLENPNDNISVLLLQNFRWDNAINNLKPKFIKGNELVFDYETINTFLAGNEYRFFDTRTLRYLSENVLSIYFENKKNNVQLKTDERKTFKVFLNSKDINGRFFIKNNDGNDGNIDGDYAWIHFALPYASPLINGSIYVLGDLTNNSYNSISKMIYNYEKKQYELSLFLKQGYYNYIYSFVENGKKVGDVSFIEGSHYETDNEYTILVYYKPSTQLHYSLIATKAFNTTN
ncbi:MAG: DUF5103 domain-containing protein [Bacteroidota bacterium]